MVLVLILLNSAFAFNFYVPSNSKFCFTEDLSTNVLCLVKVSSLENLNVQVIDTEKFLLYDRNGLAHSFSFTAFETGVYKICVGNPLREVVKMSLEVTKGVKAKDYTNIAKVEDFNEIQLKMRKLEDYSKDIHKKLQYLRQREEELRGTNVTIHNRIIGYSVCTVMMLMCLALIQILYLKRFFKAKKLI